MANTVTNSFAALLAQRKEKISTVSRATGISRTTLTKLYYETSLAVSFETLAKLCSYFQCDIGDILKCRAEDPCSTRQKGETGHITTEQLRTEKEA